MYLILVNVSMEPLIKGKIVTEEIFDSKKELKKHNECYPRFYTFNRK